MAKGMRWRALAALVLAGSAATVQGQVTLDSPQEEPRSGASGVWIVQLTGPATTDGASEATVVQQQNAFRAAAARAGISYVENYSYRTLANGLSITTADIDKVSRLAGVRAVFPAEEVTLSPIVSNDGMDLAGALETTGAAMAQTLGFNGAGIKIAIIDSGVDYVHPDLGGCFGAGCKVTKGYDYVGDAFTGSNTPVPDPDPRDVCGGHGTHVAGIAAASAASPSGVTGVAPAAELFAYRVFGCTGSARTDMIAAAMERAYADGANVINMSLGSSRNWPFGLHSVMATKLAQLGVVTVASAGNDAGGGTFVAGSPGAGVDIISVASFENEKLTLPYFTVTSDDLKIGYQRATGSPAIPTSGSYPLVRTGTSASADDACAALPAGSLTGSVALIRRGTCGFNIKAINAQNAGAAMVVLYNNVDGRISATVAGPPAPTIPVVSVSKAEGELLDARLAAGAVTMTWAADLSTFINVPTGGLIAGGLPSGTSASTNTGSTYGPAPTLDMKPDIGAPGGNIRSTYPIALGSYAILGGTSMASPHVAGAVALLLQARPTLTPGQVRAVLQNSAKPRPFSADLSLLEMVHRQGAGMLDIAQAVQAQASVSPGKLSLGEFETDAPQTRTLTITNDGPSEVTYTLGHESAVGSTGSYFPTNGTNLVTPVTTQPATLAFSSPSVTVPSGGTATVNVSFTRSATAPIRSLFGGWVTLTPGGGGAVYRVPYLGFKGDYQSIPVLTFVPQIGRFNATTGACGSLVNWSAGMAALTYTLSATDQLCVRAHIDHPAARFALNVRNAANTTLLGKAVEVNYIGRNSAFNTVFAFGWDGTLYRATGGMPTPNGAYSLQLQVLKANGSVSNPAHFETFTFPIVIAR